MRERRRKHDDAHFPLGGKGKRANRKVETPPAARVLVPYNRGEDEHEEQALTGREQKKPDAGASG